MIWVDVLPPMLAVEQTAWEKSQLVLRLHKAGMSLSKISKRLNTTRQYTHTLKNKALRYPYSPVEQWLADDYEIKKLQVKIISSNQRKLIDLGCRLKAARYKYVIDVTKIKSLSA